MILSVIAYCKTTLVRITLFLMLQKKESIVKGQHASNVFRAKEVLSRRRGANTHAHPAPRAHTTPELAS